MPDAPDRCPYCERAVDPGRADFGDGVLACEYCGEIFTRPQPRRRGTIDALYGGAPPPARGAGASARHDRQDSIPADDPETDDSATDDAGATRPAPTDPGPDPLPGPRSEATAPPPADAPDPAPVQTARPPDHTGEVRAAESGPPTTSEPPPPAPAGVAARRGPPRRATLLWSTGILVLLAALAAQIAWQLRDELARHPPLRPLLTTLCAYTGCDVPLLRAPEQMRIVARDVRRHPEADDALRVSLTFSNGAAFTQAWPDIRLRFIDLRDRVIAERRFTPSEYLPPDIDAGAGMAARGALQTALDIADPGTDAVNFTFEFL